MVKCHDEQTWHDNENRPTDNAYTTLKPSTLAKQKSIRQLRSEARECGTVQLFRILCNSVAHRTEAYWTEGGFSVPRSVTGAAGGNMFREFGHWFGNIDRRRRRNSYLSIVQERVRKLCQERFPGRLFLFFACLSRLFLLGLSTAPDGSRILNK